MSSGSQCKQVFPDNVDDQSDPAGVHVLPQVIDQSENVIIAEGTSDYLLSLNGILLGVQNMTWGGQLGFQQAPSDPFDVPAYGFDPEQMFKDDYDPNFNGHELPAGYGVMVLPTMSAVSPLLFHSLPGTRDPSTPLPRRCASWRSFSAASTA